MILTKTKIEKGAENPIILEKVYNSNSSKGIRYVIDEGAGPYLSNYTGYVYLWTFILYNETKFYLGYHKSTVSNDKFYSFSSEDDTMIEWYCNPDCKKEMRVLHWGTHQQMAKKEQELLQELKNDGRFIIDGGDYFNKKVPYFINKESHVLSGIDHDKVDKFSEDLRTIKQPKVNWKELKGSLLNKSMVKIDILASELRELDNLQVRDKETDAELKQELNTLIQINIDESNSLKTGSKKVIVLLNRTIQLPNEDKPRFFKKLLIGGKHTSEVYGNPENEWGKTAKLDVIEIPESVHSQFNDVEIYKIGNNDNRKEESAKPIQVEDLIEEYKFQSDRGIEWDTPKERARAKKLLRRDSWPTIRTKMETYVDEKANGKRIDYTKPERKQKVEKDMREKLNLSDDIDVSSLDWVVDNPPKDGIIHIGPYSSTALSPLQKYIAPLTRSLRNKNNFNDDEITEWINTNIKEVVYHVYFSESGHEEKFDSSDSEMLFGGAKWAYNQKLSYIKLPQRTNSMIV